MSFPIKEIQGHKITFKNGKATYLYQASAKDLEQLDETGLSSFYDEVQLWLNSVNPKNFFRVFLIDNQIFINTDAQALTYAGSKVKQCAEFKQQFYHGDDLYNHPAIEGDLLSVNSKFYLFINLYNMPPLPSLCELMQYGDSVVNFRRIDGVDAKRKLHFKRKIHYANLGKELRDIESESSFSESERILESIVHGDDSLFEVEGWIVIKGDDKKEVIEKKRKILALMNIKNYPGLVETAGLNTFYKNNYFFDFPTWKRAHFATGSYLKQILPFSVDRIHGDGIKFYSRAMIPLQIDINDKYATNRNILVTGSSGCGKSFLVNKIIHEEIQNGSKAIILDYDNSFERNTRYAGGVVYDGKFNPMAVKSPYFLKEFIMTFVNRDEFDQKEEGRLYSEIEQCCDQVETFRDLIMLLEKSFDGLSHYFSESWQYFDQDAAQSKYSLVYVDCNRFSEKILPGLIIYLLEVFKQMEGRRIFVLEESWHLLNKASGYVVDFFRTFRKKGATAIAISQSLEDFIKHPVGRVIADNTYHKFYFPQNLGKSEFISSFDESQIASIRGKSGEYSEFYYKSEHCRKVVRYYGNTLEYALFNTTKEHTNVLNDYLSKALELFNFRDSIDYYVGLQNAKETIGTHF